jgi:cobalt/nickel transport protein
MKTWWCALLFVWCLFGVSTMCPAHFGMLIPSDSMVMANDSKTLRVTASFSHPFEMAGMTLERPVRFGVMVGGKDTILLDTMTETKVMEQQAWAAEYKITRPGVYTFYLEPKPYWEPAEDIFIVHYTKTIVAALGDEEGWDEPLGMKTEIIPLTRPFGLYEGNAFQGLVLVDGKPVPHAQVEIEHYNVSKKASAPSDYMITQVVKADGNGVFTYAAPKAGWWGFSALSTSDTKLKHNGEEKEVEIGAVLWVEFVPWNEKQ